MKDLIVIVRRIKFFKRVFSEKSLEGIFVFGFNFLVGGLWGGEKFQGFQWKG